jgi:peroxiredoxin
MARSTDHEPHIVGVCSTDDAREPETSRARRADRVGGDAVRRAAVLAVLGAVVGAIAFGLVLGVLTNSSASVVVAGMIGGAVLIGAIGALWGAFSRMGANDDWREAMPDTPRAPDIDLTAADGRSAPSAGDRRSASQLVERGALTVTGGEDATASAPAGSSPSASDGGTSFAAPSSAGRVLSSEDFVGKVPVTMVFCPEGPASDDLLRRLDDVFPRFGDARVQLLAVLAEDAATVQRRHDGLGVHLPLLADPEGRLAADYGVAGMGRSVRAFIVDRDGALVDEAVVQIGDGDAEAILERTTAAAAAAPERFAAHPAHRS